MSGTGVAVPAPSPVSDVKFDVEWKPGVVRLATADVARSLAKVDAEERVFTFDDAPDSIRNATAGSALLLEDYALRKVVSVRTEGPQTVVETDAADLTDLFQRADIAYTAEVDFRRAKIGYRAPDVVTLPPDEEQRPDALAPESASLDTPGGAPERPGSANQDPGEVGSSSGTTSPGASNADPAGAAPSGPTAQAPGPEMTTTTAPPTPTTRTNAEPSYPPETLPGPPPATTPATPTTVATSTPPTSPGPNPPAPDAPSAAPSTPTSAAGIRPASTESRQDLVLQPVSQAQDPAPEPDQPDPSPAPSPAPADPDDPKGTPNGTAPEPEVPKLPPPPTLTDQLRSCHATRCAVFGQAGSFQFLLKFAADEASMDLSVQVANIDETIGSVWAHGAGRLSKLVVTQTIEIAEGQYRTIRTTGRSLQASGTFEYVAKFDRQGLAGKFLPVVTSAAGKAFQAVGAPKIETTINPKKLLQEVESARDAAAAIDAYSNFYKNMSNALAERPWESRATPGEPRLLGSPKDVFAGSEVLKLPVNIKFPVPVSGIPFVVTLGSDLAIAPAFSSNKTVAEGKLGFNVDLNGDLVQKLGTLDVSGIKGKLGVAWRNVPWAIQGLGINGFTASLSLPKVTVGVGVFGFNANANITAVHQLEQMTPGTIGMYTCSQTKLRSIVSASVGVDATFKGFLPLPKNVLLDNVGKRFDKFLSEQLAKTPFKDGKASFKKELGRVERGFANPAGAQCGSRR